MISNHEITLIAEKAADKLIDDWRTSHQAAILTPQYRRQVESALKHKLINAIADAIVELKAQYKEASK